MEKLESAMDNILSEFDSKDELLRALLKYVLSEFSVEKEEEKVGLENRFRDKFYPKIVPYRPLPVAK